MALIKLNNLQALDAQDNYQVDGSLYARDGIYIGTANDSGLATFTTKVITSPALSGATYTFTNAIPAGSVVWGVTARVITTITGPGATWGIGESTSLANKWGSGLALTAGTTTSATDWAQTVIIGAAETNNTIYPYFYKAATSIVLTPNSGSFTAGVVKIAIHYATFGAPSK